MQIKKFDLVILGSGSTAFAAAIKAAELGKTAAMTENRTLGGTCVNRGCLPSKNLIAVAGIVHEAAHPRYPGIDPARLNVTFAELVRQKDEVIAYYREKKYQSIVGDRISMFEGTARFVDRNAVEVGDVRLEAERFLVATGSRPFIAPINGLDDVPFRPATFSPAMKQWNSRNSRSLLRLSAAAISHSNWGSFFTDLARE
jgi:mercuric reductase